MIYTKYFAETRNVTNDPDGQLSCSNKVDSELVHGDAVRSDPKLGFLRACSLTFQG